MNLLKKKKKMFKKYFLIFFISIFLTNCSSMKETLSLKKKTSTNEFLVKKKNPLVMPPEFEILPSPTDNQAETKEEVLQIDEEIDISKLLKNNSNKKKQPRDSSKSLEKSISDLLKDK